MKTLLLPLVIAFSFSSIAQSNKKIEETDSYAIFIDYDTIKLNDIGHIKLIVQPKPGFKVNDAYPHKVKNLELQGLKNKGLEISQQRDLIFDYTFKRTGKPHMKGTLRFSVVNAETCLIERYKFEIPKGDD